MIDEAEDYAPEMIEEYLKGWNQLLAAAEGATGHIPGHTSGRKDRLGLVCMLADLERAADQLPLAWASTREVFRLQHRMREWRDLGVDIDHAHRDLFEVCQLMARSLGWRP